MSDQSLLAAIFEDEDVVNYVNSQEDAILEGAEIFHQTPQQIKDYIAENLDDFVVPGDLEATYENLVNFVAYCTEQNLNAISDAIVGD